MTSVRILARILFYLSRVLCFLYFGMALFSLIAFTCGWGLNVVDEGQHFQVYLPFTHTPMLLGDYNTTYIVFYFLVPLIFYGLFFLLLGNVFRVFYQPRLFTAKAVRHLQVFYLGNFIVPLLVMLSTALFATLDEMHIVLTALHYVVGIFAYFLAAIFRQGVQLQNEQDLYI